MMMSTPATINHLVGVATVLGALVLFGISQSYNAEKIAHKSEIIALTARPNPYTSLNANADKLAHAAVHDSLVELLEERFARKLETLPRPPEKVVELLTDLKRRVEGMEVVIKECILYEKRISVLEQANGR